MLQANLPVVDVIQPRSHKVGMDVKIKDIRWIKIYFHLWDQVNFWQMGLF